MVGVPKPIVPPTEIPMPTVDQIRQLLASCTGRTPTLDFNTIG
jgi:hypothetical protein